MTHQLKSQVKDLFLKLTESAVAKRNFFEMQGLKLKRGICAGTFCLFKPKIS
jgi:ABC-type phosphate/phosphonate transport system substrate-binding protein